MKKEKIDEVIGFMATAQLTAQLMEIKNEIQRIQFEISLCKNGIAAINDYLFKNVPKIPEV